MHTTLPPSRHYRGWSQRRACTNTAGALGRELAGAPQQGVAWAANNVREASLQAFMGLKKTIQMDAVPKRMRGRWNAADTLVEGAFSMTMSTKC